MTDDSSGNPANAEKPSHYDAPARPRLLPGVLVAIVILLVGSLIFRDFLIGEKVLLYKDVGGDSVSDTYPTFIHLSNYLGRYGFPLWSFSSGMGQSVFHLSGNLLWEPVVWLPRKLIAAALVYQHLLKTLIAGCLFFQFLRLRGLNLCGSLIGAVSLVFSAQMCMGSCWIISADDTVCLTFVLFAAEAAITSRRWVYLPMAVALSGLVTVFHLYLSAVLLCLYVPARLFELRGWRPKASSKICAQLAMLALLGVGLGAVVFLGSFYVLMHTPRASGAIGNFAFGPAPRFPFGLGSPLYYITAAFRLLSSDLLGAGDAYCGWENYYEAPQSYCGLIALLLFPQAFIGATRRQRILYSAFLALILVGIAFPWFRYLFWLFKGGYFRAFSLFEIFVLLTLSATALSNYSQGKALNFWTLGATLALLLGIIYFPNRPTQAHMNRDLAWMATGFLLSYTLFLIVGQMMTRRAAATWIIFGATAVELVIFERVTVNRPTMTKQELKERIGYNDEVVDAVRDIKSKDSSFFRITKNWGSADAVAPGYNDSMVFDYYATMSYSTYNNLNYIEFLMAVGAIDPANTARSVQWSPGLICCPVLLAFACEKYVLTLDPVSFQLERDYEFIRRYNDVYLFRNNNSLPLGVVFTDYLSEDIFSQLQASTKQSALLQFAVLPDSGNFEQSRLSPVSLEEAERRVHKTSARDALLERRSTALKMRSFEPSHINGTVRLDQDGLLVLQMPFDAGWHCSVDGRSAPVLKVDVGLLGVFLSPGEHTIELVYRPPLLPAGAAVTVISGCIFAFSIWRWPRIRGLSRA